MEPIEVTEEPPMGSVVLAEGTTGTAWQRFYRDGLWHSTTGRVHTWAELVSYEQQCKRAAGPLLIHNTHAITRPTHASRRPR